ncbi:MULTISPECIES: flagellar protein [Paenibacillus]|uniref:flagellar protein n=1 Tax=Paenibacillus TaxID=44249 RepID=UPI00020D6E1E|nr:MULTISPECIES: flagellar protein [Paenibacillus]EGL13529.1 putative flagellar operon protein TIGR03826 [Paenibacillus sp. HGF7]EPD86239.1 flagellar operon protein [Paenibacillus sp. HGH0039]MBV6716790.1 flagellar protein [Paenibacillus chitinolyticus]MEC0244661.1 flagellar protein [Paenibacillus chitinolyticus]
MSMNVQNCPRCGKLFVKGFAETCPACVKDIEAQYVACADYLRQNRKCDLQELHEETEVPMRQIIRFIREGRISIADSPNLTYPCEVCGNPIREHTMCDSCRQRLVRDVNQMMDEGKNSANAEKDAHHFRITDRLKDRH